MFEWVVPTVLSFVGRYGWLAIFCYMALETGSILHFAPSELVVPFAASRLVHDPVSFGLFVVVTTAGATLGSLFDYSLARRYGVPTLLRYGRYVGLSRARIDRSQALFRRFGEWTVFAGRLLPFVRGGIGWPAGLARMDRTRYVVYTAAGSALFNTLLTALAYSSDGRPSPFDVGVHLLSVEATSLSALATRSLHVAARALVVEQVEATTYLSTHGDLVVVLAGVAVLLGWVCWLQRDWIREHPHRATMVGLHAVRAVGLVAGGLVVLGALASPASAFAAITWAWNDPVALVHLGLSERAALLVTGLAVAGGGVLQLELGRAVPPASVRRWATRVQAAADRYGVPVRRFH